MGIWYTTLEVVLDALDWSSAFRNTDRLRRAIEGASRSIDGGSQPETGLLGRRFYPEVRTRTFPQPRRPQDTLDLGGFDLLAVTELVAGGVTITADQYYLESATGEAPYDEIALNRSAYWGWPLGSDPRRNISVTGPWGYTAETTPAGATASALTDSATTVNVTDAASIGVGSLLLIGTERLIVTDKAAVTTGQTLQAPMAASAASVSMTVTTGSAFHVGEVLLLGAERMLVQDVTGNTVRVKRQLQGTVLAAHAGDTIYAYRTCEVIRGALGTTAAAHDSASAISANVVPPLAQSLCVGLVLAQFEAEMAAYGQSGTADSERPGRVDLQQLVKDAQAAYHRLLMGAA